METFSFFLSKLFPFNASHIINKEIKSWVKSSRIFKKNVKISSKIRRLINYENITHVDLDFLLFSWSSNVKSECLTTLVRQCQFRNLFFGGENLLHYILVLTERKLKFLEEFKTLMEEHKLPCAKATRLSVSSIIFSKELQ